MEGLDLDDSKAKSRVVDTLLPILRAVANPVEREDYVQKIARALRVDPRAVQSRLRSDGHRQARHQPSAPRVSGPGPDNAKSSQGAAEADLEGHCLSVLLQRPGLLLQINNALLENQLLPMHGQDFQDVSYRAIFEAWETLAATDDHSASIDALRVQLPADLHSRIDELLVPDEDMLADEQLIRDVALPLLRLRIRNLERLGRELGFLRSEAQSAGDMRARQYDQAQLAHGQELLRIQKALSQRWGWVSQG
jgi:DNA primase